MLAARLRAGLREKEDGMTTAALRQNVFISYSHADTKYLKLFPLKLQPAVGDKLSVWSDQKIPRAATGTRRSSASNMRRPPRCCWCPTPS